MNNPTIPNGLTLKQIGPDAVPEVLESLKGLSRHHNNVGTFGQIYPLLPFELSMKETAEQLREKTARIEALYDGDSMVAFCKSSFAVGLGEIDYLYVDESWRGRGLGDLLMRRMLNYLTENSVELIDLRVVVGNDDARRFYEKFGFQLRSETLSLRADDA